VNITAEEVLRYVIEWLAKNAPELLARLYDDVPPAKTILAGPSAAEQKLRKLQALDGTED
jgi:hypothetical protein